MTAIPRGQAMVVTGLIDDKQVIEFSTFAGDK